MTIKAFGYALLIKIYKREKDQIEAHGNGFVNSGVKLAHNKQYLYLLDSDDKPFKNQVSCVIHDEVNKPTQVTIVANVQSIEYREDL